MRKIITVFMLSLFGLALVGCTEDTTEEENNDLNLEVSFTLTDSGQTRYFDADGNIIDAPSEGEDYYGQDAQYVNIEQAYENNNDGTITDLNTGLMWQQTSEFDRISFDEAFEYVEDLELGGYDDWRLPTIDELYSLANFDGELLLDGDSQPYLDTDYFYYEYDERMSYAGQFWSSTLYVGGGITDLETQGAFGFNFADGHIKAYGTGYYFDGTDFSGEPGCFVLAVRGEENVYGVNDFVDNGDGTVTDNATGLMWADTDNGETYDWVEALAYAEGAEYAGYSDWRVASAKEMQSIIDYTSTSIPALDESYFTVTNTDSYFWTSTTHGDFKDTAIYLSIGKAYSTTSDLDDYYDWHGAGAQRSDPKTGEPEDYDMSSVNATDLVRIYNYVLLVRDAD